MGGDFAPKAVVEGVLESAKWRQPDEAIVLYGRADELSDVFAGLGADIKEYELVDCPEVIMMSDHPVKAVSEKVNSSIVTGFKHLAGGLIDGFASAGNTGAMMAATMGYIKVVAGLTRPAIASMIPVVEGSHNLLLDVGLNADCKPEMLVQFALLGSLYSQFVLGVDRPRVALLNIGEEAEKGNILTKRTHELMAARQDYHFVGNVEGHGLFTKAHCDVIVCDGFVGNVVLKEAESFYHLAQKRQIKDPFFDRFNFEHYGGTPVLGVNAPVVIAHGKSTGRAIDNMIKQTSLVIASDLCSKFKAAFPHA